MGRGPSLMGRWRPCYGTGMEVYYGWFDISPPVSERAAVFPGDTPYRRESLMDWSGGHHLALGTVHTTLHVGAHADAPLHYHPEGAPIDAVDPRRYIGPCQVVFIQAEPGERIVPSHLGDTPITAPRVLFATGSFPDPDAWRDDFNALSPELIHHLADRGVRLVGIDTPSVDPADSKALESHQALHARGVAVLEGLVLSHVLPGNYFLVAPPLKLVGADASPVRAVLLPPDTWASSDPEIP
ncbi:MAG TPA: cyclase family protein [Myxococcaceae bacterium]|nr:cyclase family protein [Myxococcaceae bacterium]